MSVFITDRSESNVTRLKALAKKGWQNMTAAERAEWTGDPLTAADMGYTSPVNLMAHGPRVGATVELTHRLSSITATALEAGTSLYAVNIIEDAAYFENKTLTMSVGSLKVTGGGSPLLRVCWYDENGYEAVGASLSAAGTVTFTTGENTQDRAYLAVFVYVTNGAAVTAGASVRYNDVMLEFGDTRHAYVPYTAILPTDTTKGAYNYSDMNRVEMAVAELAERQGVELTTKTDWGLWDIPTETDVDRICENIRTVTGRPVYMSMLDVSKANNIESVLQSAYEG